MVERFLALGMEPGKSLYKPYPLPKLVVEKEHRNVIVEKLHLQNEDQPILALCPGAAYGPSKQWPAEYFAEVAKEKRKEGWRVWLIGAPSDEQAACLIQEKTNQSCVNLIGKTNLAEAIDLLSLVDAVITNDSGTMHIAAALDRPVVAVYGSTSPQFTPPLGEKVKVLSLNLDCSPCFKRTCPLKHWRCMRDLKPELVLTALKELLHS